MEKSIKPIFLFFMIDLTCFANSSLVILLRFVFFHTVLTILFQKYLYTLEFFPIINIVIKFSLKFFSLFPDF
jgi:hypothetical protein